MQHKLLNSGALGQVDQAQASWVARLAAAREQEREATRVELAALDAAPAAPSVRAKALAKPPAKGKSTPAAAAARSSGPMSKSVARGMIGGEAGGRAGNSAPGGRAGAGAPDGRAKGKANKADRAKKPFKMLSTEEKKARKNQCASYLRNVANPARKNAQLKPVPAQEQAMLLSENDVEWIGRSPLIDFPYFPSKLPLFASKRPAAAVVVAVDDADEEGASSSFM